MNSDIKLGTLFTGGGGFDIGAMAAGLTPVWGVEYIAEIAAHANSQLGDHVLTLDILTADPRDFEPVDWLHASPPCPSFSVANANKGETEQDIALGAKVAEFIEVLKPKYFSLENVYGYRNSQSWAAIVASLHACGYGFIVEHINSADFGVPQKRRRMIVRAVRDTFFSPAPMHPTHSEGGDPAWVGWWEAVKDIAHTFPPSQLAPWQVKRLGGESIILPAVVTGSFAASNGKKGYSVDEPGPTVDTVGIGKDRAILVEAGSGTPRAIADGGKVVALTTRALARFQTFPDWYDLPDKKTLAVTIIGNAVPCLLAQRIVESLL